MTAKSTRDLIIEWPSASLVMDDDGIVLMGCSEDQVRIETSATMPFLAYCAFVERLNRAEMILAEFGHE